MGLLRLPAFCRGRRIKPVVVDGKSKRLYYNPWTLPLEFLDELLLMSFRLPRMDGTPPLPGELEEEEARTAKRLDGLNSALSGSRPVVTWILILINFILFLMMELGGKSTTSEVLISYGAKVGPLIWAGEYWRLVTPAFLHIGFLHLFSNCIIIFFVGPLMEALVGWKRLLLIYLASGVIGNLLSLHFSPYLSAGASTGVFGIVGGLVIYGFRYRKEIPPGLYRAIILYLLPFIIYNLILSRWDSSVDNYAHIGGLAGGVLTTLVLGAEYPSGLPGKLNLKAFAALSALFGLALYWGYQPYGEAYKTYYYVAGATAAARGDTVRAVSMLGRSLDFDPRYEKARDTLGQVYANLAFSYYGKKEYRAALKYFDQALQYLEPREKYREVFAMIYERIGRSYGALLEREKAIRSLRMALVFNPRLTRLRADISALHYDLARESLDREDPKEAEAQARKALQFNGKNGAAMLLLGEALYCQLSFSQAAGAWKEALLVPRSRDEARARLRGSIFRCLYYPSNVPGSRPGAGREAVRLKEEGERILADTGSYPAALERFQRSARMDGSYASPHAAMATVSLMLNDGEEAERLAGEALQRDPRSWEGMAALGGAKLLQGKTGEAMKLAEDAERLNPRYARAHVLKGEIFLAEGRIREAIGALDRASALQPSNVPARIRLAWACREAGEMKRFWVEANTAIVFADSQGRQSLETLTRRMLASQGRER
jgi:membrane associated rhomboid family serine protease/cytochrome c-type biogenesis protein CcmH/NrfG